MPSSAPAQSEISAKAARILAGRTLDQLIDCIEETTVELHDLRSASRRDAHREQELVEVRGWLIAELDRRDASAFDRYLDGTPLRVAFGLEAVRP